MSNIPASAPASPHEPSVSVVIPTFRDWSRLAVCLDALAAQTYPGRSVEIIVVNNDILDAPPTSLVLAGNVRILTEGRPGSYAARNAGIAASTGDILAFTDSDCIPDADWLATGVERLQSGVERVAGHVELFTVSVKPSLADRYEMLLAFDQAQSALRGTSVTANMMTWRRHFVQVGSFDASLMSGGDMEWGLRAHSRGIPIVFAPECIVRHPTRATLGDLFKKARRVAGGSAADGLPHRRGSAVSRFVRSLLPPKTVLKALGARHMPLLQRTQIATLAYCLKLWTTVNAWCIWAGHASPRRS